VDSNVRGQSSLVMPDPGSESGAGPIRHPKNIFVWIYRFWGWFQQRFL